MRIHAAVAVAVVLLFIPPAAQAAKNLLFNPGFDVDLAAWSVGATGAVATHTFSNFNEPPASGAVKVLEPSALTGVATLSQCVKVTAGKVYSASVRYFNSQPTLDPAGSVHILLEWSSDGSCGAPLSYEQFSDKPAYYFTGYDIQAEHRVAPPTAQSVRVHLGVFKPAGHPDYSAVFDDAFFGEAYCAPGNKSLCLADRFRVTIQYAKTGGSLLPGYAIPLRDSTGAFYFFNPENLEVMVKVLNGCAVNNRIWVFAGGLTNLFTRITVTDQKTGIAKTYDNPQGKAFQPIQDTAALSSCN